MSYARFRDDSDVYVFMDVHGWLECCGCSLGSDCFEARSTLEMVDHLGRHLVVPDSVIPDLWADDPLNFPPGGDGPLDILEGRHG